MTDNSVRSERAPDRMDVMELERMFRCVRTFDNALRGSNDFSDLRPVNAPGSSDVMQLE